MSIEFKRTYASADAASLHSAIRTKALIPWLRDKQHLCRHEKGEPCPLAVEVLAVLSSMVIYHAVGALDMDEEDFVTYMRECYRGIHADARDHLVAMRALRNSAVN